MTVVIAFGSAILLLRAVFGTPYRQSWYQRWSRHT